MKRRDYIKLLYEVQEIEDELNILSPNNTIENHKIHLLKLRLQDVLNLIYIDGFNKPRLSLIEGT